MQAAGSTRTGRTTVPGLTIVPVDPHDDDAVRRWTDLHIAVEETDLPGDPPISRVVKAGMLRHPWPGTERLLWLAIENGETVGSLDFDLSTVDNLDMAPLGLEVHPDAPSARDRPRAPRRSERERARRRSAPTRHRVGPGRRRRGFRACGGRALGPRRDRAQAGPRAASTNRTSRTCWPTRGRTARATPLLQWVGPTPDEHLAAMAELTSRMSTDAPMDDLAWEPEVFDADRHARGRPADPTCGATSPT